MNKKLYFLATAAGLMTLASCSSDNDAPATQEKGINEITIAVTNTNANSRGARPLWSSEGANQVNSVKVALYKWDGSKWADAEDAAALAAIAEFNQAGWTGPVNATTPGTDSAKETKTLKLGVLSESTQYSLVSYAWNDPADFALADWTLNKAFPFNIATPKSQASFGNAGAVEEVFAGYINFTTDAEGLIDDSYSTELVMERSVAGILGYFTNVPLVYKKDGSPIAVAGVAVTIAAQNDAYKIPYNNRANTTDDLQNQAGIRKVADPSTGVQLLQVPGSSATQNLPKLTEDNIILDVPVPDAYLAQGTTEAGKRTPDYNATYEIPASYWTVNGITVKENCIIGGQFMIPTAKNENCNTFGLVLYGYDDMSQQVALRYWVVSLPAVQTSADSSERIFNINRNYFYGFGVKTEANPDDPDDTDEPLDLTSDNNITISLEQGWEVINNMIISKK